MWLFVVVACSFVADCVVGCLYLKTINDDPIISVLNERNRSETAPLQCATQNKFCNCNFKVALQLFSPFDTENLCVC